MFTPEPIERPVEDFGELTWTTKWKQVAMLPFMPPFRFSDQPGKRIALTEIARALDVRGAGVEESLRRHEHLLTARWRTVYAVYLIAVLVFIGIMLLAVVALGLDGNQANSMGVLRETWLTGTWGKGVAGAAFLLLAYAYAVFSRRVSTLLSDRYYAETLSAVSVLYILAELRRDEPITSPLVKRMLLIRLGYLARSLLFLSFRFPAGRATQSWVNAHFAQMLDYVRERERWVLAPVATTAAVLQRDLASLAPILVRGTYGEFAWPQEPRKRQAEPRSRAARLSSVLTRALGFLLPVIVLTFLLIEGKLLKDWGVPSPIVAFVLLAWFLLSINGMFRLGVIERFINMTKAIKELK